MKYYICLLLLITSVLQAQIRPQDPVRGTPAIPRPVPAPYTGLSGSYIRTWEPRMPTTDTAVVQSPDRLPVEVKQTTEYRDGLERPLQTVVKGNSPTGKDSITPYLYDPNGREVYHYLPYTQLSDGNLRLNPFNEQSLFYKDTVLNPAAAGENIYYSTTEYEASPLNRLLRSYPTGNAYINAADGKFTFTNIEYRFNTALDSVQIWTLGNGNTPVLNSNPVYYLPGTLYKRWVDMGDYKWTIEYRNKQGQLVLRKIAAVTGPGSGNTGYLCNYFVYNDRGLLGYVITPQGNLLPEASCFYRYDNRNRLVTLKNPDADSLEMVYDRRDRLIASRDGVQRKWGMMKVFTYDDLSRVTMTGLGYMPGSARWMVQDYMDTTNSTQPIPFIPPAAIIPQVYSYYDHYNYAGKYDYDATDLSKLQAGTNPYAATLPTTPSMMTKGLITGKKVLVSATGQWLLTSIYYDDKGRVIQTIADNFTGGKDIITRLYDFSGKLLSTYQRHTNPHSTLTPQSTLLTGYHYDAAGRLDSLKKMLNDDPSLQRTVATYAYNEQGQLLDKQLDAALETLHYDYNIRSWISGINKPYTNTLNSNSNWFGQEICYESGFTNEEFNGDVTGVKWKTKGDGLAHAFGYAYDYPDRLITADYTQQNNGSITWTQDLADYSVSNIVYDNGGNIQGFKQKGMNGAAIQTLDSLKYSYISADKLTWVTDKVNNPLGFHEINNNETTDYTYDANGNISKDANRGIDTILYDYNNRASHIAVKDHGTIDMVYDAEGVKLAKVIADTSNTVRLVVTSFTGGFVYYQDTLQYIPFEEGRIRPIYKTGQPVKYTYDYFLRDYLGNVRVVLGTEKDTGMYAATMETAASGAENSLFSNIDNTRTVKPSGYPTDNTTNPNAYIARLNGNDQKIGPSLVLRVMAGDTIQIGVKAWYQSTATNTSDNTPEMMVTSLLSALNGVALTDGVHMATGPSSPLNSAFSGILYNNLKNADPDQNLPTQPKAYLNYVLFDDQFNMVNENAGVRQVQGEPDSLITLGVMKQPIRKTGFLYIYTSNESAENVYFDNLVVQHLAGPLLEETHYYPFGGVMAGLSNHALKGAGYPENKLRFKGRELQHNEFNDGWELNWYDFDGRVYDPQISRFHTIDLHGYLNIGVTPYSFFFNNPVSDLPPRERGAGVEGFVLPPPY